MTNKYTIGAFALSAFTLAFNQAVYAQEDAALEEVVVTGIRASLEAAVDAKRNDGRIVDSVVAEDIGKLPDNNVAEALQRVTGVSINRDFGVGSEVSIRGLPQNRVEINGRSSVGDGRSGVSFDDFPASFLQAVEVVKSPTPEMIEGALGGTISLKTARPLDLKERVIAVSLDAEYADKADNWAPIFSGSFGNNWDFGDAGSFGVMASVAYQDRWLRQDTASASLFPSDKWSAGVIGLEDTPAQNTPSGLYIVPDEHKFEPFTEQRERTAFNVSMQWAPASEQGSFYIDLNSTERDGGQEAYSILSVIGAPTATENTTEDANGQLNNYVLAGSLPIPKTWSQFRFTESFSNAIGGEWNFTDSLKVSGEYAVAESDTMTLASEMNLRAVDPVAEAANPADANQWYTDVTIINSQDQMPTVDYLADGAYTDASHLAFREYRHRELPVQNKESAMRLDVEYSEPFGLEWFSALKTGVRFTDREYEKGESQIQIKDIYKKLTRDGNPDIIWLNDLDNVKTFDFDDAFEHAGVQGVNDLTSFTVYDAAALRNPGQTYEMVQNLLAGTNLALTGTLRENLDNGELKGSYSLIEEDTSAFYVQGNFDFDHARIIVGGRYVKSEITSTAYNQEGDALVTDGNTYSDFLPSLNVTVDLTEDTLLRFGGAKVMSRPNFGELSPTFVFNSDKVTATRGNPQLDPYRATQFDMAVEHYFGTGNMVSATVFYKDVASFLSETIYCAYDADAVATQNTTIFDNICLRDDATSDKQQLVFADSQAVFDAALAQGRNGVRTTTNTNGESGYVRGYELGYQQAFDFLPGIWSGLGVNANYTYADSEQPGGTPLEDISENTYNTQVYWEYEDFAVRLAYTYRDKFLDGIVHKRVERVGAQVLPSATRSTDPTLGNDYRDGLSQLDLSASWDVTDSITLVANVSNLTGEPTVNQAVTGTTFQLQESDRRFSFGVRAKF